MKVYKSVKGMSKPKALFKELLMRCKTPLRPVETLHNLAQGEAENVTCFALRIQECLKGLLKSSDSKKGEAMFQKRCFEYFKRGCLASVKEKVNDMNIHSFKDVCKNARELDAELDDVRSSSSKRNRPSSLAAVKENVLHESGLVDMRRTITSMQAQIAQLVALAQLSDNNDNGGPQPQGTH